MKRSVKGNWFEDNRRDEDQSLVKGLQHTEYMRKQPYISHEKIGSTEGTGMVMKRNEKRIHKALG